MYKKVKYSPRNKLISILLIIGMLLSFSTVFANADTENTEITSEVVSASSQEESSTEDVSTDEEVVIPAVPSPETAATDESTDNTEPAARSRATARTAIGELEYTLNSNGTAIVAGLASGSTATLVEIPDTVSDGTNIYTVTAIAASAFYGNTTLLGVTIGDNVTSIGSSAFYNCTALSGVKIGNGVDTIGTYAFRSCTELSSLEIGNSVTSIGNYAFMSCASLKAVAIPDSVISIGIHAFHSCTELSDVTIGDGVETIGYEAFHNCSKLSNLTIGNNVKTIGNQAFRECTSLTKVEIPNSVTTLGTYVFYGCAALNDLTIGSGIETISGGSFASCTSLPTVTIPNSVKIIDTYAFNNCKSLETITIPEGVTSIGLQAFQSASLTTVTIPDTVTYIGNHAFYDCTSLTEINRKKIADVDLNLAGLSGDALSSTDVQQEYYNNYDSSVVTSDDGSTVLSKAAKWTNNDKTTADIRVDYGESESNPSLDVVFVIDYSNSMGLTTAATKDGTQYSYPRVLFMEDIMQDCIDQLINSGYDIRIAMTGFGTTTTMSTSGSGDNGFLTDVTELKSYLNSQANGDGTRYAVGLSDAKNLIDGRSDTSRQPVVIFLSDGMPTYTAGLEEAQELRDDGVAVHPLGIYLDEVIDAAAIAALQAISYDEQTYYVASDTSELEEEIVSLLKNVVNTLNVTVVDELSNYFKLGTTPNIEVSAGTVTVDGKYIYWDLTGEAKGVIHNMVINSDLDEEYSGRYASTNASLKTQTITATEQPKLYRSNGTTVDFAFEKIDGDSNNTLSGVEFELYSWTGTTAPTSTNLVDTSSSGNWVLVDTVTSDTDGLVSFTGLPEGSFQLVETKASTGYELPTGQWRIEVDSSGNLNHYIIAGSDGVTPSIITGLGSESDPYQLANYKVEDPEPSGTSSVDEDSEPSGTSSVDPESSVASGVDQDSDSTITSSETSTTSAPKTGDMGTFLLSIVGLLLIASSVYIVIKKKKATGR